MPGGRWRGHEPVVSSLLPGVVVEPALPRWPVPWAVTPARRTPAMRSPSWFHKPTTSWIRPAPGYGVSTPAAG